MTNKIKKLLLAAVMSAMPMSAMASAYNGTTVSPAADGKTYSVNASSGDTLTLGNVGSSGGTLAITFKNNVSGGSVVVSQTTTQPASAPTAAPGKVFTYYDVTLSGLTNADVTSANWSFPVTSSWLSSAGLAAANVRLYHYENGAWVAWPTQVASTSGTGTNFTATGSSFSPFAVAGTSGLAATGSSYLLIAFLTIAGAIAVGTALKLNRRHA